MLRREETPPAKGFRLGDGGIGGETTECRLGGPRPRLDCGLDRKKAFASVGCLDANQFFVLFLGR